MSKLRAYLYKPADIGRTAWREGDNLLRLDGIEPVGPEEAEIFMVMGVIRGFPDRASIERLPYFNGNEARHVFFDIVEEYTKYYLPCLFFRCTLHQDMLEADPNSIAWPWPVKDFAECIEPPAGGFEFDVSFHGWLSQVIHCRLESTESCMATTLKCDFARYPDFYGTPSVENSDEGRRRWAAHHDSLKRSRLALCPESLPGDFPYRFFEAMSAGRVPVLVGSGEVFPFADEIPYHDFMIHVPRQDAQATGKYIADFLARTPDEEIIERGKLARFYWEKYLDERKMAKTQAYAVEKSLRRLRLIEREPVLA